MDEEIKNSVSDLLNSLEVVDDKKENLQLEMNHSINKICAENKKIEEEIISLKNNRSLQVESIEKIQKVKGDLEKRVERNVNIINDIEKKKEQLNLQIKNEKTKKNNLVTLNDQNEDSLSQINKQINDILTQENKLASMIKEATSLDDIIKMTGKYEKSISGLKQKKLDLETKANIQSKKIEEDNLEINKIGNVVKQYEVEINKQDQKLNDAKKTIEDLTKDLSININDINKKKDTMGVQDSKIVELKKRMERIGEEKQRVTMLQNKFLKYPNFPELNKIIKDKKILLAGIPNNVFKNNLPLNNEYFYSVRKPNFSEELDSNEISPFIVSSWADNTDNLNKIISNYKNEYKFSEVEKATWKFNGDDDQIHLLCKLRNDSSIWQMLYYGSSMDNEQRVIKVDVYDTLGNLRYTQYPSYDNEKIIGVQEQWFSSNGSVFLISQSFGDSEQFQLISSNEENGDTSIDKIISGIDNLFLYWLDDISDEYMIFSDLESFQLLNKLDIDNKILYIADYDDKNRSYVDANRSKINTLLCDNSESAQLAYWKNKSLNIWRIR